MLNIENIKGVNAINKLRNYSGKNPYLIDLKRKLIDNGKIALTTNQVEYIFENHETEPYKVDRVISVSEYIATQLMESKKLTTLPLKIYVGYILAENKKTYHFYGKLTKNQKQNECYWIPKTQILEDPYITPINIEIDFDKHIKNDALGRIPYNHQKEASIFLLGRKKCILADDMGLGKTYSTIVAAIESNAKKILIVCPSSAKVNWERELHMLGQYDTSIINGSRWNPKKYTIINYSILSNFHTIKNKKDEHQINLTDIVDSKFDMIIIDEAHNLRDNKSVRGSIIADICKTMNMEYVWLLTGTPVANRPKDLYNLLKIINHPVSENWDFYTKRYCDAKKFNKTMPNGKVKKITTINGASNLPELSIKVKNHILRRLKTDVLDMPEKNIIPLHYNLTKQQEALYDDVWDNYLEKRRVEKKRGTPDRDLVELIFLRKYIAMETIPYTIELAETAIENGKKVIIFTTFTDEIIELSNHFNGKCVIHNGTMNEDQKQLSVDRFQNDKNIKIFIGNIISAGVAITLTESDTVIFNSFDWVPGNNEQAEDRAYRIGQKNNVTVYYQLFNETIIMRMWYTIKHKKNIINSIINIQGKRNDAEVEIINEYSET